VPLQLALAPAPALVQGKVAGSERADVTFFLSAEKVPSRPLKRLLRMKH
jgi:hypothetical protein